MQRKSGSQSTQTWETLKKQFRGESHPFKGAYVYVTKRSHWNRVIAEELEKAAKAPSKFVSSGPNQNAVIRTLRARVAELEAELTITKKDKGRKEQQELINLRRENLMMQEILDDPDRLYEHIQNKIRAEARKEKLARSTS